MRSLLDNETDNFNITASTDGWFFFLKFWLNLAVYITNTVKYLKDGQF